MNPVPLFKLFDFKRRLGLNVYFLQGYVKKLVSQMPKNV